MLPQTFADEILGPTFTDSTGFVPPDTMGAVGPTQFLFSVNGLFRAFNKNVPHAQVWSIAQSTFWGSTSGSAIVSDGHVRYDRVSQRWFITEIDTLSSANDLLLAVSSTSNLATATWTMFRIPSTGGSGATDQGCFADYDTPGIDTNGIYVGANMFGGGVAACPGGSYLHSNLYVIQKSSALTATLHFASFFNVATGTVAIQTIQGVDSTDAMATGYAISVKTDENPTAHLNVWQINNPSTISPTLSGPTAISINSEIGPIGGVPSLNNANSAHPSRAMDDLDDRLFAAEIRNGHLWTAHNIGVNSSGSSSGAGINRDAARWYDVTVSGLTLNQSGTVFDNAASGFEQFWMPTIAVSGQGHAAIGLNRANAATVVQAGAVGRLAGDPAGTMSAFSVFQNSSNEAYDDFASTTNNRWGDFTYTSLDPCDDQTIWTTQEFVGTGFTTYDWQIAAEKLLAPPPATPASASPSVVAPNVSSTSIVVTGTSTNGSGFYDTPSSADATCRTRLTAAISGGVTVNSVMYTDPTHITLNISTVGASVGPKTVTVTNPDGQVAAAGILTVALPQMQACVRTQPSLTGNNGATWTPVDAGTSLTFTPASSGVAILGGNADLWTDTAGFNQDIGIAVSGPGFPTVSGQPESWKESGGFAGTFSPNAAFVQAVVPVTGGQTYTAKLAWKANKPQSGTIYAGAGPIGGQFSNTCVTLQLEPTAAAVVNKVSSQQYSNAGSDGTTWKDIDATNLGTSFMAPGNGTLIASGNADLWTQQAGFNQDIGITVSGGAFPSAPNQPEAWKESGGFAGTFSPNAAFVIAALPVTSGTTYNVKLQWKANQGDSGTIYTGAGPIGGAFSPTRLTLHFIPTDPVNSPVDKVSTMQYHVSGSDGGFWQPMDASNLTLHYTPTNTCAVIVGVNVDLWTQNAGFNQDVGIAVSGPSFPTTGGQPEVWKESGGSAGTFSPNAAYGQVVEDLTGGQAYTFQVVWKANRPDTGTIDAAAGPITAKFSPTRLTLQPVGC